MKRDASENPPFRIVSSAVLFFAGLCLGAEPSSRVHGAETLRIVGWNMQSDSSTSTREADPNLLKQQIGQKKGVQLWGLCEVLDAPTLTKFEQGAEVAVPADFAAILGTTGDRDRLAILYDSTRFELIGQEELNTIQLSSGLRAPLVATLKDKSSGIQFLFMVNHLKRGEAQNAVRLEQAKLLNQWVRQQTLPVIAVGDYNFDYDVAKGDLGVPFRDGGFDAMIKDDKFRWIRPETLVKTQADDEFNTILDFAFVANYPFGW
ncbi:MAG: hypothetical protein L0Z50_40435, partial [Verrucomicrobiales bacterium]|nr:hypothetical protein [Verrucomicrobiales bacterium]